MKIVDAPLNAVIAALNAAAPDCLARLGWACAGGGALVLVVWALVSLLRLPAASRAWLWWLVLVKFLLGLLPAVFAFALTVALPRSTVPAPVLRPLRALAAPFRAPASSHHVRHTASATAPVVSSEQPSTPAAPDQTAPTPTMTLVSFLLLLYASGLLGLSIWSVRGVANVRRKVQRSSALTCPEANAMLRECASALGLKTVPRLAESPKVTAPLVIGIVRPTIVLPEGFTASMSPTALRLALLHELAHLRRGDLWLGIVPCMVRLLFWWFPLAWIACREWEQAREEACDAATIATAKAPSLIYGKLLVQLATGEPLRSVNMAGIAAPGFSPLKRRLTALRQGQSVLTRRHRVLLTLVLLVTAAAVLPFTVRATIPLPDPLAGNRLTSGMPRYEIVPLGTLGGEYSDAFGVNDSGQTVGAASLSEGRGHAFRTDGTDAVDLSVDSDFPRSIAFGINTGGAVAATAFYRTEKSFAFFWDGKRHYIGTLPGFGYSQAMGINDRLAVAGTALRFKRQWGSVPARAWVWQNGVMHDLGTLGGDYSHATGINNAGQVIGKADLPHRSGEDGATHAFVWDRLVGMRDLGTLPGGRNSRAQSISDRGEVVGLSEADGGARQAFVWTEGHAIQALPALPGALETSALGINASGQAVGYGAVSAQETRAVLWQRSVGEAGGKAIDLNACIPADSGWSLRIARAINAKGEIVGQGDWNGKRQAFLLRPLP